MNDDELITLMKEPFADVHMTVPADEVIRHGRGLRNRRRAFRLTGTVTLAGGVAVAVALLPAGGQALPAPGGHPGMPKLTAWTATRDPDGGITVVVNQMKDPEGLQATLRADGIPARVTFNPVNAMNKPLPAGCTAPTMTDIANAQLQNKILTPPALWSWQQTIPQVRGSGEIVSSNGVEWFRFKKGPDGVNRPDKSTMRWFPMPISVQQASREQHDAIGRSALYINPAAIPDGIGLYIGVDVVSPHNFNFGEDLVVRSPQCTGS